MQDTKEGYVRSWHADRGYGFLATDDNSPHYFFHQSRIPPGWSPVKGDRVRFVGRESARHPGKHEALEL